jgi:tetratricopeptide (TPR) repeat protein
VRESFLQAAQFVGREQEMSRLLAALIDTTHGAGSFWLLAGESGCGKSRVLDELRTNALIRRVTVFSGRAVREAVVPYHYWREVLRQMCLHVELQDEEASLLRTLIPDIEQLLGRTLPESTAAVPSHDPREALVALIRSLLERLDIPVVIIAEDLHWSNEDLDILRSIQDVVRNRPILLIGSYRDDERPELAGILQGATILQLGRFDKDGIRQFASSMLGEAGQTDDLIEYLAGQTEGNAFFLVEVVRALAEHAGELDRINATKVPGHILTAGIRQIIQSRWSKVPEELLPVFSLAAVAGRQIDLTVLQQCYPEIDVEATLLQGADAAVVEVDQGSWRFAHDKLREGLLESMQDRGLPALHRRIAEAIECVYPNSPVHIPQLAYHWRSSGDWARERPYAWQAGVESIKAGAYSLAIANIQRAIELQRQLPAERSTLQEELTMQTTLGLALFAHKGQGSVEVKECYDRARELAQQIGEFEGLGRILFGQWAFHIFRGEHRAARQFAEQLLSASAGSDSPGLLSQAHFAFACCANWMGEPELAVQHAISVRNICAAAGGKDQKLEFGHSPLIACMTIHAVARWLLGFPDEARRIAMECLAAANETQYPFDLAVAMQVVCWIHVNRNEPEEALHHSEALIRFGREHGFPQYAGMGQAMAGWAMTKLGGEEGINMLHAAFQSLRDCGTEMGQTWFTFLLADAYLHRGMPTEALIAVDRALTRAEQQEETAYVADLWRLKGDILVQLGHTDAGIDGCYRQALDIARQQKTASLQLRANTSLLRWRIRDGIAIEESEMLEKTYSSFTEGFATPDLRHARELLQSSLAG